jgi:hypothetical protein
MFKNVASQVIGVQLVTGTDGAAFTGTATAYVTLGTGTFGTGSGTITHKGQGYHTYVPTQAETNSDHIGFTFTASGVIPATIQVFTQEKEVSDRLAAGAKAMIYGTVGTGTAHTTVQINMAGGSISPSMTTVDMFRGRVLLFLQDTSSTALRGQGAPIDGNTTTAITFSTANQLTNAPASGDTFVIA